MTESVLGGGKVYEELSDEELSGLTDNPEDALDYFWPLLIEVRRRRAEDAADTALRIANDAAEDAERAHLKEQQVELYRKEAQKMDWSDQ